MDFFVYCKLQDAALLEGVKGALQSISADVVVSADIIFINSMIEYARTVKYVVVCIQNYLHHVKLCPEDIIYVFYTQYGLGIAMYPLKRAGRIRLNNWPKDVPR